MEYTGTRFTRWVGFANVLNLVLFQILFIVAAMLRPGYSPISQPASDLGVGPFGELTDAGVVVLALLKIALAVAFFFVMRPILRVACARSVHCSSRCLGWAILSRRSSPKRLRPW